MGELRIGEGRMRERHMGFGRTGDIHGWPSRTDGGFSDAAEVYEKRTDGGNLRMALASGLGDSLPGALDRGGNHLFPRRSPTAWWEQEMDPSC
jgi:hypothetical protein